MKEISKSVGIIGEDIIDQMTRGKWIENKRIDKATELEPRFKTQLRMTIKDSAKQMSDFGTNQAAKILGKVPEQYTKNYIDIDEDEILEQLLNSSSTLMADTITDGIRNKARLTIINGIKAGISTSAVVRQLRDLLEPYDARIDGSVLETIVRTNYMKIYNESSMAFNRPLEKSGFIQAYQYSAILDDRTTEFCEEMNNRIFKAGDIGDIEPPNHFNCRSRLIPITIDEIESEEIFGASEKENKEYFPDGKFEPDKMPAGFEYKPGGFWTAK